MKTRRQFLRDATLAAAGARLGVLSQELASYIHCSDLYMQFGDPDDHFDLACIQSLRHPDLIVLDNTENQAAHPGRVPVTQVDYITGRNTRVAEGRTQPLVSVDDPRSSPGADAIVQVLRSTKGAVRMTVTGWLTDVAAAYNQEPDLFREKAELMVFAGDAQPFAEANAQRDPLAFVRVMSSGARIRWVPCFDGGLWVNEGRASYVSVDQADLFPETMAPHVVKFFSYFFLKSPEHPIRWLARPVTDEDWQVLHRGLRNLWASPLLELTDRPTFRHKGVRVAGFEPVTVGFGEDGVVGGPHLAHVERFRVWRQDLWPDAMVAGTIRLLNLL